MPVTIPMPLITMPSTVATGAAHAGRERTFPPL
jgi:hypothetical protein